MYHFFKNGLFSQWYKTDFVVNGVKFTSAEQFMMWNKAKLFMDNEVATKILATNNCRKQKELGREVIFFNQKVWDLNARKIVYAGNYAKFTQSPDLLKQLYNTNGCTIVESSPKDLIWANGLSIDNVDRENPLCWPGKNWLGETLTKLRNDLLNMRFKL